jgi:hypothetical protein
MMGKDWRRPPVRTTCVLRFEDVDDKSLALVEMILSSTNTDYTITIEPVWSHPLQQTA